MPRPVSGVGRGEVVVAVWIAVAVVAVVAISCVPILAARIRRRRALELTLKVLAGEAESESGSSLDATATCAAIVGEISAKALPQFVEGLIPAVPEPPATQPKDDYAGLSLSHGQVLDLLQRLAALQTLDRRVNQPSTGPNAPERDVFEELALSFHPGLGPVQRA